MSETTKKYTIAVIPGDGIGKEVTPWAQKALEKAAEGVAEFEYERFDLGAERYLRDGAILPEEEEERIKKTDAILLGAVGDPRIKAGILERGLLLKLRFDLDQYVNLRPSKLYKGVTSPLADPGDIDFVVVREGTEGLYCGAGGAVRRGTPNEVATEVSINTAYGVERVVRYAFQLAMKRRKHVTLVHKKNVLVNAGDMWQRIVNTVAEEYPEVSHDYLHIDATTIFMVSDPSRFDVILTDNLFGDIISRCRGRRRGLFRLRLHQRLRRVSVDVRADPRFRSGHRRSEQGQSDRCDPVGRHAAAPPRLRRGRRTHRHRSRSGYRGAGFHHAFHRRGRPRYSGTYVSLLIANVPSDGATRRREHFFRDDSGAFRGSRQGSHTIYAILLNHERRQH